jgi:hypothetical protein
VFGNADDDGGLIVKGASRYRPRITSGSLSAAS